MYILLAGRVDVLRKSAAGGTQLVGSLLQGDVFGGREYFIAADDSNYLAGTDAIVFLITEDSFNDLSWSRPEILFEIIRAAYMPLRKLSASEKTASAAAAAPAKPAAPKPVEKPAVKPADTTAAEPPPVNTVRAQAQQAVRAMTAAATGAAVPVSKSGFFPEGHKYFPGITKPEFAKLVFPKDYVCPFCKKDFKDFRVFRSKLYESSPMRFDLRKYYTDFQTEWYDVITCHNCYFSTFHTYFTEPKPIQKAKIEKELLAARAEVHMDFNAERDVDYVFTSYYLAIVCADGFPSLGKQIVAKLWGNLSWLYEDLEDKDMEVFCAAKSAEWYEKVYTETRLTPIQEQITCLSIAGMQHRAGLDNNLKKFVFSAKTHQMGDKTYSKLAEDFMYELKLED